MFKLDENDTDAPHPPGLPESMDGQDDDGPIDRKTIWLSIGLCILIMLALYAISEIIR